jgi:hydrogenase nickel incorporation protein HypA/HybF
VHEAAITEALLQQVTSFLPEGGELVSVRIEIGELEHLDERVMQTAWRAATDGTDLGGAGLSIERVALIVRCRACGREHRPEDPAVLVCPRCGAVRPEVVAGSGVRLLAIDVDMPEEA